MQRRGASQRQRQEADQSEVVVRAREAAAAFQHERFNMGHPQQLPNGRLPDPASPSAKRRRINRVLGDFDDEGSAIGYKPTMALLHQL